MEKIKRLLNECNNSHDKEFINKKLDNILSLLSKNDFFNKFANVININVNFVISPFSIQSILMLTAFGSSGNTLKQFDECLDIKIRNENKEQIKKYVKISDNEINTAFGVFTKIQLLDSYISVCKEFDAECKTMDLESSESLKYINKFVFDKTKGMIIDPIKTLNNVIVVLVNTIAFVGKWLHEFDVYKTFDDTFYNIDNSKSQIKMMHRKGEYFHWKEEILELKYSNPNYSMIIIMGLKDLRQVNDKINYFNENKIKDNIQISIPKFKLSYRKIINDWLKQMGMVDMFRNGNFIKMTNSDIFVDEVIHQAYIEVDEKGTKAAATTIVTFKLTSVRIDNELKFNVDHPFTFVIYDNLHKRILFVGKINKF